MIFALLIIFLKSHLIKITFRKFKFSMQTVKNIYAVGFPSIIMQSIGSIMIVGLNGILAASEASVTVLGVYYKLQSFVFMPCFGLNQALCRLSVTTTAQETASVYIPHSSVVL